MRVVVTGADGFLGWHTSVHLRATTQHDVVRAGRHDWNRLPELVAAADAVLHIAGINRGTEHEVRDGNIALAEDLASAILQSGASPTIVFANSTQSATESPYGVGKRESAALLKHTADAIGSAFTDAILPNLYGEHGRPAYNSFVATFVHKVIAGDHPEVQDRMVELVHVQDAARLLVEALSEPRPKLRPTGTHTSVAIVLQILRQQFAHYVDGEIPPLPDRFHVGLFNTLRAAMFPEYYPMPLIRRTDERGSLVETVRAHGSEGQTFFSTSRPGITRGQHFHLRKMERFVVVKGQALISLRRVLTDEVVSFTVAGIEPVVVDMPTLWAHKIVNTGERDLTTMFWTNELYDPNDADTYAEEV